jgi:hypothetical protein
MFLEIGERITLVLFPIEDHGKLEQESREIYELYATLIHQRLLLSK